MVNIEISAFVSWPFTICLEPHKYILKVSIWWMFNHYIFTVLSLKTNTVNNMPYIPRHKVMSFPLPASEPVEQVLHWFDWSLRLQGLCISAGTGRYAIYLTQWCCVYLNCCIGFCRGTQHLTDTVILYQKTNKYITMSWSLQCYSDSFSLSSISLGFKMPHHPVKYGKSSKENSIKINRALSCQFFYIFLLFLSVFCVQTLKTDI